VGVIGAHAVDSVNVATRAQSSTPLQPAFSPTAAAMQGHKVVLINSQRHQVLVVDTASGRVDRLPMPGLQPPDQITVRDRLVFVNASDGASALVIGSGGVKTVTKYTGPPPSHPKPLKFPTPARTKAQPVNTPATPQPPKNPHRPGTPAHPRAVAGNASATVSWGAAAANGGAITTYKLSWTGSDGSSGKKTVSGNTLGTPVGGLANGTSYVFTVAAVNSAGQGPGASAPPVTPSSNVPNAPSGVTATASQPDGSVSLSWSAPGKGGAQVASYTITEVGTGTQVESGVTGTSTTLGASQGLVVGTAVQFQVTAIGTSGLSSTPSAASNAVTPFQAPGAPAVTNPVYATSGTSATLTVSCDTTCQAGRPAQTYQVTLSPSGPSLPAVTAASGGGATTISLTGLTPNTSYTASVTVTDTAGVTGPPDVVALTMPGPPSVSNVKVSGSGLTLAVTATVKDGGETTTCSVSVSGGASASGACGGTISVGVSTYNISYTVTFTATNPAGSTSATGTGTSGLKALAADATDAFGTCAQYPVAIYKFCGGDSDVEPGPTFTTSTGSVKAGTVMQLSCWTTGGVDHGNVPAYRAGTNVWVHVTNSPGPGYMSILWFPNPNSVTSGLPKC
jgi:hypothetical protein